MTPTPDNLPDGIDALRAALAAERLARREAEVRAAGAEAMVAHLKLLVAKLKRDRFGASSERGRKLIDQLELELGELVAAAGEDAAKAENAASKNGRGRRPDGLPRGQPARAPLPAHLPRERVVIPGPSACPCCCGELSELGEDITETLEVEPIKWKVIQTVRERFSCRACEAVTQPPAPFHPIARGRAGPNLLAMILEAKFGQHLPLNRQSEVVRVTFAVDTHDREVMAWVATVGAGIGGEMTRDMMLECVERRFGAVRAPEPLHWLADNGSAYTSAETVDSATAPNLVPCFTPVRSPEGNGVCEAFVKTFKRDHVRVNPRPDAISVLQQLPAWFEDYNAVHPHSGLRMLSPREFIAQQSATPAACPV